MPRFFTRFSAAALAFVFTFSSLQFSAKNLFDNFNFPAVYSAGFGSGVEVVTPANPVQTPTVNPVDRSVEQENVRGNTRFSTLTETQSELKAKHMRGYQSLYEMQAELFAECVAKLKRHRVDGYITLNEICRDEKKKMNEQGPQRFLLPDATQEQTSTNNIGPFWWETVITYWFGGNQISDGERNNATFKAGLLPPLKKRYSKCRLPDDYEHLC